MRCKSYARAVLCCAVVWGFFTAGCKKLIDYVHDHGDADYRDCNIKKLIDYFNFNSDGSIDTVTYTFTYNYLGNPVSVINTAVGTGNPNFFFSYNKYGRLSQLLRSYEGNYNYEQWDTYFYNNKGQIVADSNYAFGLISPSGPQKSDFAGHIYYEYDSHNRISHVTDSVFRYGMFEFVFYNDYQYDARGNLITGATYDNKPSYLRTNSIWMFYTRNYSVNNPFTATQYNEHGLPLFINGSNVLFPDYYKTRIEYSCP
jgi:hypothetical protein